MIVLDTDIVIWILRGNQAIVAAIDRLVSKESVGISTITVAEIYKNIFPIEMPAVEDFIFYQELFPVSLDIAKIAGLYWNQYHQGLKNLSLTDCLIAATAKIHRATLVTMNIKHFPMDDISLFNPTAGTMIKRKK